MFDTSLIKSVVRVVHPVHFISEGFVSLPSLLRGRCGDVSMVKMNIIWNNNPQGFGLKFILSCRCVSKITIICTDFNFDEKCFLFGFFADSPALISTSEQYD